MLYLALVTVCFRPVLSLKNEIVEVQMLKCMVDVSVTELNCKEC